METNCKALKAALLAMPLCLLASHALAAGFLQKLEGNWYGKGRIEAKEKPATKKPLACRMTARFDRASKSLFIKGRCGASTATGSFKSILREKSAGRITGRPILQHGDLATIAMSGRANAKSLKMTGRKGQETLFTTFILQGTTRLQSQSGRQIGGRMTNFVYLNWTKR